MKTLEAKTLVLFVRVVCPVAMLFLGALWVERLKLDGTHETARDFLMLGMAIVDTYVLWHLHRFARLLDAFVDRHGEMPTMGEMGRLLALREIGPRRWR